jgi:putative glycosyltransferase
MIEQPKLELSIVSTLYKSRPFLEFFLQQVIIQLEKAQIVHYEILFVNDGSPDDSVEFLLMKKQHHSEIKIIDLSRNFGHHHAIQAGLSHAKGELIFLIDNDLETPASVISDFIDLKRSEEELDVIYGFQAKRKGGFFERISGSLFWRIFNKLSDTKIPLNMLTERLMTKRYVSELLRLGDANLFLGGMFHWVGFKQKGIAVVKSKRKEKSTYTKRKKMELMIHAITSFSGKPLEWLFYFGFITSFLSVLIIFALIILKLAYMQEIQIGWTSIIVLNIFILGLLSTFLGVIGMYVNKIFRQVQDRPNVIIKAVYE